MENLDSIDREYQQLMEVMQAEDQAEALLRAVQGLIDAEKLPPGRERRAIVAASLELFIRSLPSAWDSIAEAPDLTNDLQRIGAVRMALAVLFDLT
jgi:hypothetical protein